ncbi:hypothetical protein [Thermaerobacter litoralis]
MQVLEADPWRTGLVGLVAMGLFYPAIFLVAITIVGIPVALAMVFVYALARLGGYMAVAMLLGRRISAGRDPLLTLGVGVFALAFLRYVPVIGWLAGLVVASLSIGAVIQTRFGTRDAVPSGPAPPGRTDGGT